MGNFGLKLGPLSFAQGDEDFVDQQEQQAKQGGGEGDLATIMKMLGMVGLARGTSDYSGGGYARGTSDFPGGSAIVGEEGPEMVTLPRGSSVMPSDRLRDWMAKQGPGRRDMGYRNFEDNSSGPGTLDAITGNDGGPGYSSDLPGYDPTGIEDSTPEHQEIRSAADSGTSDTKPHGWLENIANVFGNTPMESSGQGAGGLAAGLLTLLVNHQLGKAGKNLKGRRDAAATQQSYEMARKTKDEDSRRLLQRQLMIDSARARAKAVPPSSDNTIDVPDSKGVMRAVSVNSQLGSDYIRTGKTAVIRAPKSGPRLHPSSSNASDNVTRAQKRVSEIDKAFRTRFIEAKYPQAERWMQDRNASEVSDALEQDPSYMAAQEAVHSATVAKMLNGAATQQDIQDAQDYIVGLPAATRQRLLKDPAVLRAEAAADKRVPQDDQ